ncbi:hypothetical protein [Fundidesulfovibrio soli]|uniref:hypothetical protein n=1 Tax=Fundidesulfovibrio soli TaxID=2922716 RepID=UPI001FAFEF36|nr:hypothetical protein [Fundidesulfovibrio soli]
MTLSAELLPALAAVLTQLESGLPQDESVLRYAASTHADASPEALAALFALRDDPESSSLAELLLFPGEEVQRRLEPALEAARATPEQARELELALEDAVTRTWAILPGGQRLELPLEAGEAAQFVRRLRPEHTAPPEALAAVERRFPGEAGLEFKIMLRHCRLEWTPQRRAYVCAVLGGLEVSARNTADALAWTLRHLADADPQGSFVDGLGAAYAALEVNLKRARDFGRMLRTSSYEVMLSQGVRAPHLHEDGIRREMELVDMVCQAVAGRPAWTLAGLGQMDMGDMDDPEALMEAFTRLGG